MQNKLVFDFDLIFDLISSLCRQNGLSRNLKFMPLSQGRLNESGVQKANNCY